MSGIDTGGKRELAGQTPDSGTRFTGQERQGQTPAALQKRAEEFAPKLKSAEQEAARAIALAPLRKPPEEEALDFAPLTPQPPVAAPQARGEAALPMTGRDAPAAAGLERMAASVAEAVGRPAQGAVPQLEGGLRIPLDGAVFGAQSATVTVTATEILILLHGVPGVAPPDPRAIAEAARNLSLSLLQRLPDRRVTLGYEPDEPAPVEGADRARGFNPLLGPVR
jgi:hypothetical protein